MSVVGFIRRMIAAGLDMETALTAGEAFEAECAAMAEVAVSPGARRTRRWRERKASQASQSVTCDAGDALLSRKESPQTPKETQLSSVPPSPPKGGSSPTKIAPTKAELDAIWDITPKLGRERSSRKDLERALTAAVRRGHEPEKIRSALLAAYASPSFSGDHAKGVHRLIENDRWQSFEESTGPPNAWDRSRDAEILQRMRDLADQRAANA